MKKIILASLLLSFSATSVQADPQQDIAVGLLAGTVPIAGQLWLLANSKRMPREKTATALLSSLLGSYIWFKTGQYFACSAGNVGYLVPCLPALAATIFIEAQ